MSDGKRYWVQVAKNLAQEVSKEDFIKVERSCGFHSKFGPNEVATHSFSIGVLKGWTVTVDEKLAHADTQRVLREASDGW